MGKRRGNNEGTVFQDKDGVWWAQLPPDDQGKRPKRRAKSQREALAKLREMERGRANNVDLTSKSPTVAQFAETWLEQVVRRRVKASTYSTYRFEVTKYLVPAMGAMRIQKLTTAYLQRYINDLADQEYGHGTIHNIYVRLSAILDTAVKYQLIPFNPALSVDMPRVEARAAIALPIADVLAILARTANHRYGLLYQTIVTLGLRRGEGLGASWRGIDWEARTISIAQQVQRIDNTHVISPTTKNKNSKRILPLPPFLYAALRTHWDAQQHARRVLGPDWKEHGLIFTNEYGAPIPPTGLSQHFAALQGDRDPKVRVHDLRHTCASFLGNQGTPPHIVSAILGHSARSITEHYTHASMEAMRDAIERLERTLFPDASQDRINAHGG